MSEHSRTALIYSWNIVDQFMCESIVKYVPDFDQIELSNAFLE